MPKGSKLSFGIADDGVQLKLAVLTKEANQVYIQNLEQVELDSPLYLHPSEGGTSDTDKVSMDSGGTDLNIDEFTADNLATYQIKPYEQLFRNHPLFQGIIAINVYDDNLIKLKVSDPNLTPKQKKKLVKENLTPIEFKKEHWSSSVVILNNQPELWIHHGDNKLLDILEANRKGSKSNYYYQLADANDVALASLFQATLTDSTQDTYILLYLGNEYHHILYFEGNKWTASLPLGIPHHEPDIQTIYSRLSFALDEAHITEPQHLLICGDYCSEEYIEYLNAQMPNTEVGLFVLSGFEIDPMAPTSYSPQQIARFVLPIALAWKALQFDKSANARTNFLPPYIVEGQKVFKIAWHGFVAMGLLFVVSLSLTITYLNKSLKLSEEKSKQKALTAEFGRKKARAEAVLTMAKAIDVQATSIETIKTLLIGKNPWNEIITTLANSFQSRPISWLKNLKRYRDGFSIEGVTSDRNHVVYFASLFPNAKINKVVKSQIRNTVLWDFEIVYNFPVVNWYAMMEKDAQALKKIEEKFREKSPQLTEKKEKEKGKKQAEPSELSKLKSTITEQASKIVTPKKDLGIPLPIPSENLIADKESPIVIAYQDFMTAYNNRQDWLMIDRGVKFINNYPLSPLLSYVRWYMGHRAWLNKEYDRAHAWINPILKKTDVVYPYALLLDGIIYRDLGDTKNSEDFFRLILQDYPLHPVAPHARKLLKE